LAVYPTLAQLASLSPALNRILCPLNTGIVACQSAAADAVVLAGLTEPYQRRAIVAWGVEGGLCQGIVLSLYYFEGYKSKMGLVVALEEKLTIWLSYRLDSSYFYLYFITPLIK